MANISMQQSNDSFVWSLHKTGLFTFNSIYSYLICNDLKVSQVVWWLKISLKIKSVFGSLKEGLFSLRITWQRGIGMEICPAVFVANLKPSNIFSLNAHIPWFCGEQSIWC